MSRSNANDPVVFVTESEIIQAIREAIAARPGGAPGWTPELQVKAERSLRGRLYRLLEGIANEAQNAVSTALANDRDRAVSELERIAADNGTARDWVVNLDPKRCYWIADLDAVLANDQYRGRNGTTEVSGYAHRMTYGSAMHFQNVLRDRYPTAIVERIVPSQP